MKIDNTTKPFAAPTNSSVKSKPASENSTKTASSDDVRLSALAEQFQSGDAAPPFDSAKVQEIKQAIAEGRFTINAGAIAGSLLDSARDLISAQRRA